MTKRQNLRFPGRCQRSTPVALAKEDASCMLGLLPGTIGRIRCEDPAAAYWLPVFGLLQSEVVGFCDNLSVAARPRLCSHEGRTNLA